MVISSLVIDTQPPSTQSVSERLSAIEGVEVHGKEGSRLIITIEAPTVDASHGIASGFIEIPGVIGINLIYANFEDDPNLAGIKA